ncbi:MAG: SDR family NAD(P)-dependent oxidoreductase, partial [Deltaproteobacteria bacterium]|nr:SDR family NAD(P)-dependent oxidoreductase [Deltaproteobacteria bacterium]
MSSEVVLITGCASGIGKATAEEAARRGHRVIGTDRCAELLKDVPDSAALKLVLDVTQTDTVAAAVARAQQEVGPITALVNNAGFLQAGPIELISEEQV